MKGGGASTVGGNPRPPKGGGKDHYYGNSQSSSGPRVNELHNRNNKAYGASFSGGSQGNNMMNLNNPQNNLTPGISSLSGTTHSASSSSSGFGGVQHQGGYNGGGAGGYNQQNSGAGVGNNTIGNNVNANNNAVGGNNSSNNFGGNNNNSSSAAQNSSSSSSASSSSSTMQVNHKRPDQPKNRFPYLKDGLMLHGRIRRICLKHNYGFLASESCYADILFTLSDVLPPEANADKDKKQEKTSSSSSSKDAPAAEAKTPEKDRVSPEDSVLSSKSACKNPERAEEEQSSACTGNSKILPEIKAVVDAPACSDANAGVLSFRESSKGFANRPNVIDLTNKDAPKSSAGFPDGVDLKKDDVVSFQLQVSDHKVTLVLESAQRLGGSAQTKDGLADVEQTESVQATPRSNVVETDSAVVPPATAGGSKAKSPAAKGDENSNSAAPADDSAESTVADPSTTRTPKNTTSPGGQGKQKEQDPAAKATNTPALLRIGASTSAEAASSFLGSVAHSVSSPLVAGASGAKLEEAAATAFVIPPPAAPAVIETTVSTQSEARSSEVSAVGASISEDVKNFVVDATVPAEKGAAEVDDVEQPEKIVAPSSSASGSKIAATTTDEPPAATSSGAASSSSVGQEPGSARSSSACSSSAESSSGVSSIDISRIIPIGSKQPPPPISTSLDPSPALQLHPNSASSTGAGSSAIVPTPGGGAISSKAAFSSTSQHQTPRLAGTTAASSASSSAALTTTPNGTTITKAVPQQSPALLTATNVRKLLSDADVPKSDVNGDGLQQGKARPKPHLNQLHQPYNYGYGYQGYPQDGRGHKWDNNWDKKMGTVLPTEELYSCSNVLVRNAELAAEPAVEMSVGAHLTRSMDASYDPRANNYRGAGAAGDNSRGGQHGGGYNQSVGGASEAASQVASSEADSSRKGGAFAGSGSSASSTNNAAHSKKTALSALETASSAPAIRPASAKSSKPPEFGEGEAAAYNRGSEAGGSSASSSSAEFVPPPRQGISPQYAAFNTTKANISNVINQQFMHQQMGAQRNRGSSNANAVPPNKPNRSMSDQAQVTPSTAAIPQQDVRGAVTQLVDPAKGNFVAPVPTGPTKILLQGLHCFVDFKVEELTMKIMNNAPASVNAAAAIDHDPTTEPAQVGSLFAVNVLQLAQEVQAHRIQQQTLFEAERQRAIQQHNENLMRQQQSLMRHQSMEQHQATTSEWIPNTGAPDWFPPAMENTFFG
ncbi:unnamed protein product [Amoebophrya sp. A120]|nr:unnamed protein product [Amoebophrya sp. A120]|eukprot:GSA120T00003440001.1